MACKLGIVCSNSVLTLFESQMAAATASTSKPRNKLDFRRCYMTTNNPTGGNMAWQSNSPGGDIMPFAVAGYGLWVSFNVASPPAGWTNLRPGQSGNAAFLTKLNSIIAFCVNVNSRHPDGATQIHYISLHHEPERDVTPVADSVAGDAYRAAQEYCYAYWRANAPSNWKWCACLQYNTLETPSGAPASAAFTCIFPNRGAVRDARRWFTPACDVVGLDGPYNYRGSANGDGNGWLSAPQAAPLGQGLATFATPGTRWYNPASSPDQPAGDPDKLRYWRDFSVSLGGPSVMIIGEFTCFVLNPASSYPPSVYATQGFDPTPQGASSSPAVAERADWISAWAEYWAAKPDLALVVWYERDRLDSAFGNGRLSGGAMPAEPESLRKFSSIGDGVVGPPPPPPPPPPGLFVPGVVSPMTRLKAAG